MAGIILDTLNGKQGEQVGLWLMRQAGRYLPEYRALRADKGGFLELVYDSEAAAEVTMQPIDRFAMDGAILFSDILIVPYAMGQDLAFLKGEGPHLSPPLVDNSLEALEAHPERLTPIYETVRKVRARLDQRAAEGGGEATLLGFAGSPWTVATYMIAGEGSRDQAAARLMAYQDPARFGEIINAITAVTIDYLLGQIAAGAEAVQLFDSWAGSLAPDEFERWVIAPNAAIVAALAERASGVPVIGFPKGAGAKLIDYARETGVDALGIDETIDPEWAAAQLPADLPVQGNLDPLLLQAGGPALSERVDVILRAFAGRPHIFNLGHGIGQHTPISHVEELVAQIRRFRR